MRQRPVEYVKKHWLIFGILVCIVLAGIYPKLGSKNGPLHTDYTVKYVAVGLIFLISGLSLKSENIYDTLWQYKIHFYVQLFTFIFIPIVTQCFVKSLSVLGINAWVMKGLLIVGCMPPPVSSAVILTKAAQGNETAAIFNSVLGSFLGILVTPMLLLFTLGMTTVPPLKGTLVQLTSTVLLPLLVGQGVRVCTRFRGHRLPLSTLSQGALLFVIYTTFCDTFTTPEVALSASDVLLTVFSVLFLQMALLFLSYSGTRYFRNSFQMSDSIAIMFASTHKSLTLGIPILRIMFHGYSNLSQISLPLLVYHPTQIIMGGLLVSQLKDWVYAAKQSELPLISKK